jgi:hypothetical protein
MDFLHKVLILYKKDLKTQNPPPNNFSNILVIKMLDSPLYFSHQNNVPIFGLRYCLNKI